MMIFLGFYTCNTVIYMSRKRKELPILENVTIADVAGEGKAIARIDDMVIFVPYVIPGDVVDIQVTKKKHSYMEGRALRIVTPSPDRIAPMCSHYGVCGGCKWQVLPYELQIKHKQNQVENVLRRIGKVELPEITPILGSKETKYYRNKLEFTFSNKRWLTDDEVKAGVQYEDMNALGFHIPNMFDKVLDIEKCYLQPEISNRIRTEIKQYAKAHNLAFFDLRNRDGFLRNIIIRTAGTGEVMLIVIFYKEDEAARVALLDHLATTFPEITSLIYVINGKANDTITDQETILYKGRDFIEEEMEGLRFKVGPKSFYQTNTLQAYELYKVAREFADLKPEQTLYDLYTGTGTIACFCAGRVKKVVGIEYVPEAIEDAKINAANNNINNTTFFAGDMKDILTDDFIAQHGRPDIVITDPPRDGMHQDVIKVLLNAAPEKIVYVSCNPATQARDLTLLDEKYKVVKVRPVDMFPHTHHVENVILLVKR